MPWIQNISKKAAEIGNHYDAGNSGVLIQISDPPGDFPAPKFKFSKIYQFVFLDLEESSKESVEFKISDEQAEQLCAILKEALDNSANVVVHCHAGICRSGAVAEIGVMMGFEDTGTYRQPNILVKTKMMKANGWGY